MHRRGSALGTLGLVVLIATVAAAPVLAEKADFEGSWHMDLERSDELMGGLKIDNRYDLKLDGENLAVTRTFFRDGEESGLDWTVVTDNKKHELPGIEEPRIARAKWRKDKLNINYKFSRDTPRGSFEIDVTETWAITKKGELKITYNMRLPNQQIMNRMEFYTREAE